MDTRRFLDLGPRDSVDNVLQRLTNAGAIRRAGCLAFEERENISRGVASGKNLRQIARELGRSPSTISRELSRNGGRDRYRASLAEKAFRKRSARPKLLRLVGHSALREMVTTLPERNWLNPPHAGSPK